MAAEAPGPDVKAEPTPIPVPDLDELRAADVAETPANFYDQDAGKTEAEVAAEKTTEKTDEDESDEDEAAEPATRPMTRAALRAERDAARAAEEAAREQEAEAARTRINDVDLAHGMANIADKGYNKAAKKTAVAEAQIDRINKEAEDKAAAAERSAKVYRGRHKNEEAAVARELEAATARTEAAAEAAKIKQEAQERGEAAVAKAWAKAETYKDDEVAKLSTERTDDDQVAWDAALAEKGPREQAMALEKRIDESKLPEAERLRQEDLAADLRDAGTKAAEAAQTASETKRDSDNKAINDHIVKASRFINSFASATEPVGLDPIGVNSTVTPAMVERLSTDLQHSFKVDFSKEPLDSKRAGGRIFGQKFIDVYRQSEEPGMRGTVFVERVDKKTGQMVRLDVISAPRPEKPTLKPGKFKVGFIAERLYRHKENQWRSAIEAKLVEEHHFSGRPDTRNPFLPGDPSIAAVAVNTGGSVVDSSYPSILQRRGMSAESAQHARKPKRLWFGLFG